MWFLDQISNLTRIKNLYNILYAFLGVVFHQSDGKDSCVIVIN